MPPRCNVLLVEDSAHSALLVNHFLSASKIAEFHVTHAERLAAAREALGRERFDAVLLDLNLPDGRGLETFTAVREAARGAAIVILTAMEDESVATTAIGQGAADYLIKGELGGEGLARRIRFAVERNRAAAATSAEPAAGRVTVLLGAKGGAGASTMAVNLAAAMSRRERNVLLVELRPHGGSLAGMLGVTPPLTLEAAAELGGSCPLEAVRMKLPLGAYLAAAPGSLEPGGAWDSAAVEALVQRAATLADHVLIDATIALPHLLKPAVARASFTVVVLEREPFSIEVASRITGPLAAWCGRAGCVGAALVNHVPFLESMPLPAIKAQLGCGIVGVIPPAREMLQSYRRQGPIVLAAPEAPVSVAYDEMAARLEQEPVGFVI
jgi:MinD-like ATPase involved in chromosome partitioning or flagellar assembly/CheY-like chemotaxis protein